MTALPAETPLRGSGATNAYPPTPVSTASPVPAPSNNELSNHFAAMNVSAPAREQTASTQSRPPPPPVPHKPELSHAVALYAYPKSDPNDLVLERGDHISVTEYMNADWWSGTNVRTGEEGIFPKNYVRVENYPSSLAQPQTSGVYNEKAVYGGPPPQYTNTGYQGQPVYGGYQQPQNPYNNPVPPMAVANDQQPVQDPGHPGKGQAMAKKFGSKLGNAAIFGAGATLGADVVNSIF